MSTLVVVDSGFGGFSLVAALEAGLVADAGLELIYVNAAPSDALGYNQMSGPVQRRATLANVLGAIEARLDPSRIVLASHTLSTIFMSIDADARPAVPVEILLDDALALIEDAHRRDPHRRIAVFGTATMARGQHLREGARARGIPPEQIVHQACPGLESTISGDPSGREVVRQLRVYRDQLCARLGQPPRELALLLGCTHYAHRPELFVEVFAELGVEVALLDPGYAAAQRLLASEAGTHDAGLVISMLSRYRPPARELTTISALLDARAPRAAAAVRDYRWVPALFEVAPG
jgi:glutamate racemase